MAISNSDITKYFEQLKLDKNDLNYYTLSKLMTISKSLFKQVVDNLVLGYANISDFYPPFKINDAEIQMYLEQLAAGTNAVYNTRKEVVDFLTPSLNKAYNYYIDKLKVTQVPNPNSILEYSKSYFRRLDALIPTVIIDSSNQLSSYSGYEELREDFNRILFGENDLKIVVKNLIKYMNDRGITKLNYHDILNANGSYFVPLTQIEFDRADIDNDGLLSYEEALNITPTLSEEEFNELDGAETLSITTIQNIFEEFPANLFESLKIINQNERKVDYSIFTEKFNKWITEEEYDAIFEISNNLPDYDDPLEEAQAIFPDLTEREFNFIIGNGLRPEEAYTQEEGYYISIDDELTPEEEYILFYDKFIELTNDGELSLEEAQLIPTVSQYEFSFVDNNQDSYLSYEEAKRINTSLRYIDFYIYSEKDPELKLDYEQCQRVRRKISQVKFDILDTNSDGIITRIQAMQRNPLLSNKLFLRMINNENGEYIDLNTFNKEIEITQTEFNNWAGFDLYVTFNNIKDKLRLSFNSDDNGEFDFYDRDEDGFLNFTEASLYRSDLTLNFFNTLKAGNENGLTKATCSRLSEITAAEFNAVNRTNRSEGITIHEARKINNSHDWLFVQNAVIVNGCPYITPAQALELYDLIKEKRTLLPVKSLANFEALATNRTNAMNFEEFQNLNRLTQEEFEGFDKDDSGGLSYLEVSQINPSLQKNEFDLLDSDFLLTNEQANNGLFKVSFSQFDTIDSNNDDKVTLEEINAVPDFQLTDEELEEIYSDIQVDDLPLSYTDIVKYKPNIKTYEYSLYGGYVSPLDVFVTYNAFWGSTFPDEATFTSYDADNDGYLSYEEASAAFSDMNPLSELSLTNYLTYGGGMTLEQFKAMPPFVDSDLKQVSGDGFLDFSEARTLKRMTQQQFNDLDYELAISQQFRDNALTLTELNSFINNQFMNAYKNFVDNPFINTVNPENNFTRLVSFVLDTVLRYPEYLVTSNNFNAEVKTNKLLKDLISERFAFGDPVVWNKYKILFISKCVSERLKPENSNDSLEEVIAKTIPIFFNIDINSFYTLVGSQIDYNNLDDNTAELLKIPFLYETYQELKSVDNNENDLGINYQDAYGYNARVTRNFFNSIDENHDGYLDFIESQGMTFTNSLEFYQVTDRNNNNSIDYFEYFNIFDRINLDIFNLISNNEETILTSDFSKYFVNRNISFSILNYHENNDNTRYFHVRDDFNQIRFVTNILEDELGLNGRFYIKTNGTSFETVHVISVEKVATDEYLFYANENASDSYDDVLYSYFDYANAITFRQPITTQINYQQINRNSLQLQPSIFKQYLVNNTDNFLEDTSKLLIFYYYLYNLECLNGYVSNNTIQQSIANYDNYFLKLKSISDSISELLINTLEYLNKNLRK
jgi:hypothetical protein